MRVAVPYCRTTAEQPSPAEIYRINDAESKTTIFFHAFVIKTTTLSEISHLALDLKNQHQ
jgi:hypothetical protein